MNKLTKNQLIECATGRLEAMRSALETDLSPFEHSAMCVSIQLTEIALASLQERRAEEGEAQAMLKRLAIIMAGSDSGGELAALTVTAQSLVDRCKTLAAARDTPLSKSACDVLKERHRQITVKGYSPEQDDTYIEGELAAAAISYIEPMEAENYWPADWLDDSFKPSDYRRNLVKACALLFAEMERYDRQEARQ